MFESKDGNKKKKKLCPTAMSCLPTLISLVCLCVCALG